MHSHLCDITHYMTHYTKTTPQSVNEKQIPIHRLQLQIITINQSIKCNINYIH